MERVSTFEVVTARLLEALKLPTEKALAQVLGMQPNAYYNRKKSQSLPYPEIIQACVTHEICLDWIFTGKSTASEATSTSVREVDERLLGGVFAALRRALWPTKPVPKEALFEAARIGQLAGLIYNKIANITDEVIAIKAMRFEAEEIVRVMKIMEGDDAGNSTLQWLGGN